MNTEDLNIILLKRQQSINRAEFYIPTAQVLLVKGAFSLPIIFESQFIFAVNKEKQGFKV